MADPIARTIYDILHEYNSIKPIHDVPIKIDILRDIIKARCSLNEIAWHKVDVETEHVLGYVKFYYPVPKEIRTNEEPTVAIIRFKASLNFCWQRFVICKEMCHCLIDTEEDRVSTVAGVKALVEGLASQNPTAGIATAPKPFQSEYLAEVMALELLCPFELRRQHERALREGQIEPYSIALRYRIPVEMAELGMYETYLRSVEGLRNNLLVN